MTDKIYDSIVGMEEQEAIKLAKEYLDGGGDPKQLLDVCRDAMDEVGKKFESGEYFLSELLLGGKYSKALWKLHCHYLKEAKWKN